MGTRYQFRNDDCADPRAERRAVVSFPDLELLTPVEKPSPTECVLWRLAAFYDVVRDHLGRERYPHPLGVWLNPKDARRLQRWVELPMRAAAHAGGRRRLTLYWADKGPATSALVPPGEIIITARAYEGIRYTVRRAGDVR